MLKKYRVTLTALEREELATLLARGKADVRKLKHAQVLLHADEAEDGAGRGSGWCDTQIAEALREHVDDRAAPAAAVCGGGLCGGPEHLPWRQAGV